MCNCEREGEREGQGDGFSHVSHSIQLVGLLQGDGNTHTKLAAFPMQFQERFPKNRETSKETRKEVKRLLNWF